MEQKIHVPNLNSEGKSSSHSRLRIASHIVSESITEAAVVHAVRRLRQNIVSIDGDELERAKTPFALPQDLRRLRRQQIHARFSQFLTLQIFAVIGSVLFRCTKFILGYINKYTYWDGISTLLFSVKIYVTAD